MRQRRLVAWWVVLGGRGGARSYYNNYEVGDVALLCTPCCACDVHSATVRSHAGTPSPQPARHVLLSAPAVDLPRGTRFSCGPPSPNAVYTRGPGRLRNTASGA